MFGLTKLVASLCICLESFFVNAELVTTSPRETTTGINAIVTFKCRTTSPIERIRWQFRSQSGKIIIHTGLRLLGQSDDKFAEVFDNKTRESFLLLKRVEASDAGTFSCLETNSISQRIDFVLRVDSRPVDAGKVAATDDADLENDSPGKGAGGPSVTADISVKTIAIAGVVGLLLFCGLIVIILVFLVMKFRQNQSFVATTNEALRTGRQRNPHGHHHKHRRPSGPDSADEPQPEDISDSATSPTGSSRSPSVDGHYSEIAEPETEVLATSQTDTDQAPIELSPPLYTGQYQGLDPVAVVQLSALSPNVYVNLTH